MTINAVNTSVTGLETKVAKGALANVEKDFAKHLNENEKTSAKLAKETPSGVPPVRDYYPAGLTTTGNGAAKTDTPTAGKLAVAEEGQRPKDAPDFDKYYKILDQLMAKANQSANQMSPEEREIAAAEFDRLSKELGEALGGSGLFGASGAKVVEGYINGMDISSKGGAAEAYAQLHTVGKQLDRLSGTSHMASGENKGSKALTALDQLQAMASRSSHHMTDAQRVDLQKDFESRIDSYLSELKESGLIRSDLAMQSLENHMRSLDLSTQEGAQAAFNQISNQAQYVKGLA